MRRRQLILLAVVGALGWSVARAMPPPGASPSLQGLAAARGLRWGTAVTNVQLQNPDLRRLVTSQSGLIVPESELKWDGVEAAPGALRFQRPGPAAGLRPRRRAGDAGPHPAVA